MLALPDVGQAVSHACVFNQAAATGGDARQLVGYLVSDSGLPLDTAALKARLAEQLPPHMVPVVLMQLAELPLSANGKLDRKALPLPTLGGERSGRPPEPGMETLVAAAFSQLLGCEVNDIDADFFAPLASFVCLAYAPGGTAQPPAGAAGDPGAGDGGLDGGQTERAAGRRSQR